MHVILVGHETFFIMNIKSKNVIPNDTTVYVLAHGPIHMTPERLPIETPGGGCIGHKRDTTIPAKAVALLSHIVGGCLPGQVEVPGDCIRTRIGSLAIRCAISAEPGNIPQVGPRSGCYRLFGERVVCVANTRCYNGSNDVISI